MDTEGVEVPNPESVKREPKSIVSFEARLRADKPLPTNLTSFDQNTTIQVAINTDGAIANVCFIGKQEEVRPNADIKSSQFQQFAEYITGAFKSNRPRSIDARQGSFGYFSVGSYFDSQTKMRFPELCFSPNRMARLRFTMLKEKFGSEEIAAKSLIGDSLDEINGIVEQPNVVKSHPDERVAPLFNISYAPFSPVPAAPKKS